MHLAKVSPSSSTHFSACPFALAGGPSRKRDGADLTPARVQGKDATSDGEQVPLVRGEQGLPTRPVEGFSTGLEGTGRDGGRNDDIATQAPQYRAAGS